MDIRVRSKHESLPPNLKEAAVLRLEDLGKYLSTIESISAELYREGPARADDGYVAKVAVHTGGPTFRARAQGGDFHSALDLAVERAGRQLKEFKRKRSGRPAHHKGASRARPDGADSD